MRQIAILIFSFIIVISCSDNSQIPIKTNRFIKANITNKDIRDMFLDYSNKHSFYKQGVLISNIDYNPDTTRCLIYLVCDKKFLNNWLKNKSFVLYDTIDNRIVIISTKLESYFELNECKFTTDTILDRYLQGIKSGLNEIYEYEYKLANGKISKKVVYFDTIY